MEDIVKERISLIDKSTDLLRASVENLTLALSLFLIGWFTAKLILEDGNIQDSKENYNVLNELEEAKSSFFTSAVVPFLAGISLVFFKIAEKNKEYFEEVEKVKDTDPPEVEVSTVDCVRNVADSVRAQFGFNVTDDNIEIEPNGWLAGIGDLQTVYAKVRATAMKAISAKMPYDEFMKILKKEIQGDEQFSGLVQSHFKTIIWDVFAEFDRQVGYKTAVCLGYRAARYEGGLIDRSRDFCIERNNEIFTFDEIMKFGTPEDKYDGYSNKSTGEFDGKPRFDYDPFFDQGGHNCRHAYSFLPDRWAIRLRPELKEIWDK